MHSRAGPIAPGFALVLVLAACGSQVSIPVPSPIPTIPGRATPEASSEAASFRADEVRILGELEALQEIADANGGIRAAGTPGYEASVDRLAGQLVDIGLDVDTPEFSFIGFRELPGSVLEVGEDAFHGPDELHALIYSGSGDVSGPVVLLAGSGCDPDDFTGIPEGAIVLTTGGGCFRRDQALNAQDAGAAAFLVGYPGRGPGELYRPTLIEPGAVEIPVVSVTDEAVRALRAADGAEAYLRVETEQPPSTLRNVVAQAGSGPRVVMLGAHLDSVLDGPGINDNGSGVAALLEVARGVVETGVPAGWAVRIGLWGAEEFGSIGSRAYVATLEDDVVAYLNLDMTGSPNGATLIYDEASAAPGSERITAAYEAWFAQMGEPSDPVDIGGSSDHFAFIQAEIPTGGLFAGAGETGSAAQPAASGTAGEPPDPCYHLACDGIENVDLARVALFADATLGVTYRLMDPD